jgi:25S rRNA (uracil2634-N3)-methyltransferase
VAAFLISAKEVLKPCGAVQITHKTSHPYDRWNIPQLGKDAGYRTVTSRQFGRGELQLAFPQYVNVYGSGPKIAKSFPIGECAEYLLKVDHEPLAMISKA